MLATFLFELISAIYIVWRYHLNARSRLIVAVLLCLATFQASEYLLCGGFGVHAGLWSKIGHSSIALLPALGVHLIYNISQKTGRYVVWAAYLCASVFVIYFAFLTQFISGATCYSNYAVFDTTSGAVPTFIYGLYYYGWLLYGVAISIIEAKKITNRRIKVALYSLAIGYASFIIPTTIANIIDPATIAGIPSIMCGFAVALAFVLVSSVAPKSLENR